VVLWAWGLVGGARGGGGGHHGTTDNVVNQMIL
jgi:hypothetical protein